MPVSRTKGVCLLCLNKIKAWCKLLYSWRLWLLICVNPDICLPKCFTELWTAVSPLFQNIFIMLSISAFLLYPSWCSITSWVLGGSPQPQNEFLGSCSWQKMNQISRETIAFLFYKEFLSIIKATWVLSQHEFKIKHMNTPFQEEILLIAHLTLNTQLVFHRIQIINAVLKFKEEI